MRGGSSLSKQREKMVKVPLLKGDLGGSSLSNQREKMVKVPLLKGDLGGSSLSNQRKNPKVFRIKLTPPIARPTSQNINQQTAN